MKSVKLLFLGGFLGAGKTRAAVDGGKAADGAKPLA
jgi:G3E family GTPase